MTPDEKAAAKRWNEKVKAIVGVFANGGLAIIAAASATMYQSGMSWAMIRWEGVGLIIIVTPLALYDLMIPED